MTTVEPNEGYRNLAEHLSRSPVARAFGLLGLALALQIPIEMVGSTVGERKAYRTEAVGSATATWGGHQSVRGPFLVVPYVLRRESGSETQGYRYVLPEKLDIDGELTTEVRRRGLFDVPLYLARLGLRGAMRQPDASSFPPQAVIQWERASLVLAVCDPKALRDDALLSWGSTTLPMEPGVGDFDLYEIGLRAALPLAVETAGSVFLFALDLHLAGSGGLSFLPAGNETTVHLRSTSSDPSFDGAYPPVTREVSERGFEATWRVPRLARGFPSAWNAGEVAHNVLDATVFGVSLFPPVDAYRSIERALKYDLLFIGLTFLAIFAFEMNNDLRVSVVQYLLVGLALCLFYLLLLSLAEQVGFPLAYVLAAAAITAMVSAYSRAVLASRRRMAAIAALISSLYAYLYVLLQLEDFALLAGSLGLFAILAAVMYGTRNLGVRPPPLPVEA